ncbi:hypothetical protein D3C72_1011160 [compost metagenome]
MRLDGGLHLDSSLDPDAGHADWCIQRHGTGDQGHIRPQFGQGGGDGVALLAAGAVGQAAHRVDGLEGRPGGDHGGLAGQGAAVRSGQQARDGVEDDVRLGHAAGAELAAGHDAVVRADHSHAVEAVEALEPFDIGLHRRVQPHAHVHGRGQQHLLVGGQKRGRGQVVGHPVRRLGDQARGGRRHHHQIGPARQLDMAHGRLVFRHEQVLPHRMAGQGRQRHGGDELGPRLGQQAHHLGPGLFQQARQLQRLVGGDAAADDQQDLAARKRGCGHGGISSGAA